MLGMSKLISHTDLPAWDISVTQTLELLDDKFASFLSGFLNKEYVLWLGSGISRGRVESLPGVVERVVEYLRAKADFNDDNCIYSKALVEALDLIGVNKSELLSLDPTKPTTEWDGIQGIVGRLCSNYSDLLNIRIPGFEPDHLLIDVVDVAESFASDVVEPDCEHWCIAMLIMEGAVEQIASANWDNLIEKAVDSISEPDTMPLKVCVASEDFLGGASRAKLLKLHGCADRIKLDLDKYRKYLIARSPQILGWHSEPDFAVMRDYLKSLANFSPTLMLGLSAQDENIKQIFVTAKDKMQWDWPGQRPALVFAEDKLGVEQKTLLQCVYGEMYDSDPNALNEGTRIRAFAKPLLTALAMQFYYEKLVRIAKFTILQKLGPASENWIDQGILFLRNKIALSATANHCDFIMELIRMHSALMSCFRLGNMSESTKYVPLSWSTIPELQQDPYLSTSGIPLAAGFLAFLGQEESKSRLSTSIIEDTITNIPYFNCKSDGTNPDTKVYLLSNIEAGLRLTASLETTSSSENIMFVYSGKKPVDQIRGPSTSYGRTGKLKMREIGLEDIFHQCTNNTEFSKIIREEMVL